MEKELKYRACETIEKFAEELHVLSQKIWEKPELGFQEVNAHKVLTDFLDKHGFEVEREYHMPTGFRGCHGPKDAKPHVSVLCEYDSLPDIGHACGHNIIAEVGVAAGLGVKAALQMDGAPQARLTVLGTPAEEEGGGKIDMINAGAFKDMDVCVMSHPSRLNAHTPIVLAVSRVTVNFKGRASHAAAYPWEGLNALDAANIAYNSISCMRQQMKPTWRIHGIFTKGGKQPNIIPEESEMAFYLRTDTADDQQFLINKFTDCCEGAARSTGCTVTYEWKRNPYKDLVSNLPLAELYESNYVSLGKEGGPDQYKIGSTDMGDVSHVVPAIHPFYYVGTDASGHGREFARVSGLPETQRYALKAAKVLAMTLIDTICRPDEMKKIKDFFNQNKK